MEGGASSSLEARGLVLTLDTQLSGSHRVYDTIMIMINFGRMMCGGRYDRRMVEAW